MQVILLEKIANLGELGSLVNVKPGYSRNYLIPQGKAVPATEKNIAEVEERRVVLEKAAQEALVAAQSRKTAVDELSVTITSKSGDEGKLFGSISNRDIAEAAVAAGVEIAKSEVRLPLGPIRQAGEYEIEVQLHSDVIATLKLVVIPEE